MKTATHKSKCGCGRDVRYSSADGKGSCNKHSRCLTWKQQSDLISRLTIRVNRFKDALEEIKGDVDGESYEYRAIASKALK